MNYMLLGIILEIIGEVYITLVGFLTYKDKLSIKIINKSIIKYWAIMTTGIISMAIGLFAN